MKKNLLESARHIAVEGPVGVGKTRLAWRLAEYLGADLLLEQPEANPFLTRFYQNPQRYALQTQLCFLFSSASTRCATWPRRASFRARGSAIT